ncbi:putative B3 domain-containing protein [Platanthera zijinensis]|uniref:B3 domain-containing protein n=1 Tax=Platanthera zijinensis TaxID=2320716 RepID=A0AAP0BLR9_9ASPA
MEKPLWERESFFKVMIGDFQTRLKIPPCFHKQFGGDIPVNSVLRSRGGRRWAVKLRREGNNLFFGEGWECFVADLSVQLGEFLLFVYDGFLGFDVKIYGITGCEKEYRTADVKLEEEVVEREMRGQMPAKTRTSLIGGPRREVLNGRVILGGLKLFGNEKALKSARSFKSNSPFFIATYRCSRQDYMTIPVSFMKECTLCKTESIILKDPKERFWTVRIAHWVGRAAISTGWSVFKNANHLIEGDVCVFEFLAAEKVMHVHIFRDKGNTAAVLKKSGQQKKFSFNTSKVLYNAGKYKKSEEDILRAKAEQSFKTDARFASIFLRSRKYQLNIPARILKGKHLTNINKTTLCDPSGRLWTVDINQRSDGRVVLSQGWFQFCEANLVQEGDICIFEVAGGIQAMDVQIRRLELPHVATD